MQWQCRLATREDAPRIVDAILESVPATLRDLNIYSSPCAFAYVRAQLSAPVQLASNLYFVGVVDGAVAGCVELVRSKNTLFLNYIGFLAEYRSAGGGKTLLRHAISAVRAAAHTQMLLDVHPDNGIAKKWYERLGFEPLYTAEWWEVCKPNVGGRACGVLAGYAQAQASHDVFGFSQFTVGTSTGEYLVGQLGDDWFRVRDPKALIDPELLATLQQLDPNRRLAALLNHGTMPVEIEARSRLMHTTVRMSADLETLLRHL